MLNCFLYANIDKTRQTKEINKIMKELGFSRKERKSLKLQLLLEIKIGIGEITKDIKPNYFLEGLVLNKNLL